MLTGPEFGRSTGPTDTCKVTDRRGRYAAVTSSAVVDFRFDYRVDQRRDEVHTNPARASASLRTIAGAIPRTLHHRLYLATPRYPHGNHPSRATAARYRAAVNRIRFVFGSGSCCIGPLTSSLIASRIQRLAGS